MKYLDPKADLTFKKVFGEHPELVKSLLNALLPFKSEEEEMAALALVISRTDNAVCLTDPQGTLIWANAAFQSLTGYETAEIRDKGLVSLFARAPGEIALANLLAFISGRVSAEETRDRIDRAVHRLLDSAAAHSEEP